MPRTSGCVQSRSDRTRCRAFSNVDLTDWRRHRAFFKFDAIHSERSKQLAMGATAFITAALGAACAPRYMQPRANAIVSRSHKMSRAAHEQTESVCHPHQVRDARPSRITTPLASPHLSDAIRADAHARFGLNSRSAGIAALRTSFSLCFAASSP